MVMLHPLSLALVASLVGCGSGEGLLKAEASRGDTHAEDALDTGEGEGTDTSGTEDSGAVPVVAFNGCLAPEGVRADGTQAAPLRVEALPFTDAASTVNGPSDEVDSYDCAPTTGERGPERWYALTLEAPREVRIEVADGSGVDVDVHLLRAPSVEGGVARGCVARDDRRIERTLEAGTWWVAVDTYASAQGTEHPGDYTLAVEGWLDGVWEEIPLSEGLTWRHLQRSGDDATRVDVLLLEPSLVTLRPMYDAGCAPVPTIAAAADARVGINASFFTEDCSPRSFLRIDGVTRATPSLGDRQRVALWDEGAAPTYRWLAAGEDDTSARHGIGSYPSLVTGGEASVEPLGDSNFFLGRHPRTAFGTFADGRVGWVVVDGRSARARGASLPALADLLVEMGMVEAVNLDGGGSSTLYIEGCSVNGVVNFPSDGGGGDHDGARSVADGVFGWSVRR